MDQSRRSFLATLGAAAATLSATKSLGALDFPAPAKTLDRVGIQIYTVRRQAAADLAGTLARISQIGYKEVEFAGFYNHPASDVRDMLAKVGLSAPSAHIAIEQILTKPDQTFADAHTVGLQWITVPSLPRGQHVTADDWKGVADQFTRAATAAKGAGFRFAFHNHNDIVKKTGDVLPIDILMKETDPALVNFQMDIYWAVSGGADPLDLLARYPGRFKMFHVKDGRPPYTDASQTDVGQGTIDFKPILARGKGIEHVFVESDSAADPLLFADTAYKYVSKLDY
jgi:sugar phosphate isomerase/epimerase